MRFQKTTYRIARRAGRVIVNEFKPESVDYFDEDPPRLLIWIGVFGVGLLLGLSLYEVWAIHHAS